MSGGESDSSDDWETLDDAGVSGCTLTCNVHIPAHTPHRSPLLPRCGELYILKETHTHMLAVSAYVRRLPNKTKKGSGR